MQHTATRPISVRRLALAAVTFATSLLAGAGCHARPTLVTTTSAAIGGTIAGVVSGPTDESLADRTVSIVNIETGERYQTTTGPTGGYSLHVPPGTYRLDVQLREDERFSDDNVTILTSDGQTANTVDVNVGRDQ